MIRAFDNVKVVFDNDYGVARVRQFLQNLDKFFDVFGVKPRRRFVQNIYRSAGRALRKFRSQLYSLRFAARKSGGRLTYLYISETDVVKRFEFSVNIGYILKKLQTLFDRHIKNFVNVFVLEFNIESFSVVAFAAAHVARNVNIGKKMHFYLDDTVAFAGVAASAVNVEGEPARFETLCARIWRLRKKFAYVVKHSRIRCGVRTRGSAYRTLVYINDFVELVDAFNAVAFARYQTRTVEFDRKRFVQNFIYKARFARPGNTCNGGENSERDLDIDVL